MPAQQEPAVLLFCNSGWRPSAVFCAAFFVFSGRCAGMAEALALFARRREAGHVVPAGAGRAPSPGAAAGGHALAASLMPTWRFRVREIERALRAPPALPAPLVLVHVVWEGLPPAWRTAGDELPVLQVLEGARVAFDSSVDGRSRWEGDSTLIVDVGRTLCGDVQLWLLMQPAAAAGAAPAPAPAPPRHHRHAARFVVHTSSLAPGRTSFGCDDVDVFRSGVDKAALRLTLAAAALPAEAQLDAALQAALRRLYLNLRGARKLMLSGESATTRRRRRVLVESDLVAFSYIAVNSDPNATGALRLQLVGALADAFAGSALAAWTRKEKREAVLTSTNLLNPSSLRAQKKPWPPTAPTPYRPRDRHRLHQRWHTPHHHDPGAERPSWQHRRPRRPWRRTPRACSSSPARPRWSRRRTRW
jgi:hypothetical protein